jgi:hypothetical protein
MKQIKRENFDVMLKQGPLDESAVVENFNAMITRIKNSDNKYL